MCLLQESSFIRSLKHIWHTQPWSSMGIGSEIVLAYFSFRDWISQRACNNLALFLLDWKYCSTKTMSSLCKIILIIRSSFKGLTSRHVLCWKKIGSNFSSILTGSSPSFWNGSTSSKVSSWSWYSSWLSTSWMKYSCSCFRASFRNSSASKFSSFVFVSSVLTITSSKLWSVSKSSSKLKSSRCSFSSA